jgi:hypothetical protein
MEIGQSPMLQKISQPSISKLSQINDPKITENLAAFAKNAPAQSDALTITNVGGAFNSLVNPSSLLDAQLFGQAEEEAATETEATKKTATDLFLEYAELTPAQRERQQILKQLGITEEELEQLPPSERKEVENKIAEIIKANAERIAQQSTDSASIIV